MRKILHFFQSDKMVPDKQVVAFYFRVRQRLLSVVVVEFVESELVSVGYFDLFLSKISSGSRFSHVIRTFSYFYHEF